MGAKAVEDNQFYQYYRTKVVLEADADAIIPVLLLMQKDIGAKERYGRYRNFHDDLRERRLDWLRIAFPDTRLLLRILDQLPWLKRKKREARVPVVDTLSEHTARHHVTPRSTWVVQLGLYHSIDNHLTDLGMTVLDTLIAGGQYFWLAPPHGVQDGLRIPQNVQMDGAPEDGLRFARMPKSPSSSNIDALIEDTADIMIRAYRAGKLVYAPQASLRLPIEYIAYRCFRDNLAYEWNGVLSELFRRCRSRFERLSARKGPVGFYKVKDLG